jgi:hypothetical protein
LSARHVDLGTGRRSSGQGNGMLVCGWTRQEENVTINEILEPEGLILLKILLKSSA